ncbi:ATP-dependent dethiobiotin synthetase BioD [Catellatospora sp. TT07R-123]|uniref:dethiobiotin synthase n=1 Tax=Catellatospora sp. TT07R-123 TaxID=2733863 RepID=UPI001B0D530C|nr:dethiobiotin synthase [Catellatospora sp. TT07R-123]GHJ49525.1 ATP-dependent dethiobiotin synthetase BioD [Catellatospora sp. TT07R-123]
MSTALRGIVLVTGTDTGVGKTIVTAAVAAAASAAGLRVAVVKPAQTGVDPAYGEVSDMEIVHRLAAPATVETLHEFPDPLAPTAAARVAQVDPPDMFDVIDQVKGIAAEHELTLVEGAGGLLVPMGVHPGGSQWTLADLAVALSAPAIVVARAGLGTLNHTALTLEAMNRRSIPAYPVLGAWPSRPELVHYTNLADLPDDLYGLLPDGAGDIDPGVFRRSAPEWLHPALHGTCDDPRLLAEPDED